MTNTAPVYLLATSLLQLLFICQRHDWYSSCLSVSNITATAPVYLSATSLLQLLFTSLVFFVYTPSIHLRSSSNSRTLRIPHVKTKHLDITLFPKLLLLSGSTYLVKLDSFSQPLQLRPLWKPIRLKPTTASQFSTPPPPQLVL